tara:strand:+ start:1978 stop:2673 length:696 start_codon:yes stop_codon:yes gene_type:complete
MKSFATNYKFLVFIPARSKSKRLKNKNLKIVMGNSLIANAINFSKKIKGKKYIYLSTDSKIYANIGLKNGAKVPFLRSAKNSTDRSSVNNAINEFLSKTKKTHNFKYLLLILPTQPFRKISTFKKVYKAIKKKNVDTVITVKSLHRTEKLIFKLDKRNLVKKKLRVENSQFQKNYYTPCGCFYLTSIENFKRTKNLFNGKICSVETDFPENIDIDRRIDLKVANLLKNRVF